MGIARSIVSLIDAFALVMRGDRNGNAAIHQSGIGEMYSERGGFARSGDRSAVASTQVAHILASICIVVLWLAASGHAEAREEGMPFHVADAPAARDGHLGSVPCWGSKERVRQLEPPSSIPRGACERTSGPQTTLVVSSSGDLSGLLGKKRIDLLPSTVSRSDQFDVAESRLDDKAANTAVSLAKQLGVERIAVPTARPVSVSTGENSQSVPALVLRTILDATMFKQPELRGSVLAVPVLILAVFVYRRRRKMREARERIQSEKAIYDAMAELKLEGRDLQTGIGAVLQRIEDAFSLCNAFIVLLEPVTLEVHHAYSSEHQLPLPMELIEETVVEIRKLGEAASDMTLWHETGRSAPLEAAGEKAKGHVPDAVSSVVWLGNRVGAMLIAQCRPGRRARLADTNALQFFTQLLAILIDGHSRDAAPSSVPVVTTGSTGEELTRRIAHEFNNLLVPIMGYAEMAADALGQGSSSSTYVEHIQSAGERAKRMVEQMLSGSRKKEAHGSFDIAAATAEILPDLKVSLPDSVSLRVVLQDGPLLVNGDATALQQAIVNLCKNAREAMSGGGTLTVSVSVVEQRFSRLMTHGRLTSGCYVRVSVADTGVGIAEGRLKQIFDPSFSTKMGEGGTGLGLAIVLRLVKRLNGQINVRSAPGAGTQFDLFFPCQNRLNAQIPTWPVAASEYAPWVN